MKKIIGLLIFVVIFTSCGINTIPIRGVYPEQPFNTLSDNSQAFVWSNLIDFVAKEGYGVDYIDKEDGLIIFKQTSLINAYTMEDENNQVRNPKAYLVLSKVYSRKIIEYMLPTTVVAEWNVRLKTVNGKTNINVNIVNAKAFSSEYNYSIKSTGVFEKYISDKIK